MLVTALEPRRKRLTALFLDGELAAKLDAETLLQSGLRIGMELDDEELHQLIQRSDAHRAQGSVRELPVPGGARLGHEQPQGPARLRRV